MKSYAEVLGLNLLLKDKNKKKDKEKQIQINKDHEKKNENYRQQDLLKTIKILNQQIVQMRQMIVNICYNIINNPNNKEDLLEK